jgi:hypothetical protein
MSEKFCSTSFPVHYLKLNTAQLLQSELLKASLNKSPTIEPMTFGMNNPVLRQ